MDLYLDTAELEEIKKGVGWGVVSGVTTNPSLVAKAGKDHETQVKKICEVVGNVSAEVVSETEEEILAEGRRIASWHPNVIVKVPLTPAGLGAGKKLVKDGVRINVTLCFSVNQALLAAAVGATIVSPFAGRLDDIGEDGIALVCDIANVYRTQNIKTKVLAASLRHPMHVTAAAEAGANIATLPLKVFEMMFEHPLTKSGLEKFLADYRKSKSK